MFKFPFGTMNELNLDWIITKVRELIDTAGTTKEKITFETADGNVQFDGSEAVTIDVQGVDTSGKLDKYTGGTNTLYATLGQNQANIPLPLPADYGGTGCTSLSDLETAMGLPNSYVARDTTAGLFAYGHEGSTERTIPVEITPNPAGIPYRDVNGNVRTNTPENDKDAANKEYVDVQSRRIDAVMNETKSLSGNVVALDDGVDGAPLKSCVVNVTAWQEGSGDASPTNIRAIHGWSAVKLARTGKNLLNPADYVQRDGYSNITVTQTGNVITISGADANGRFICFNFPTIVGQKYTIKYTNVSFETHSVLNSSNTKPLNWLGYSGPSVTNPYTFTASKPWYQLVYEFDNTSGWSGTVTDLQIEQGDTATAYEPFGKQVTVQFGDTYYGGQYNYLTGLLTVDHAIFVADGTVSPDWLIGNGTGVEFYYPSKFVNGVPKSNTGDIISDKCTRQSNVGALPAANTMYVTGNALRIGLPQTVASVAEANTYFASNPTTFVYELATPQTIQLTPQEVTLLADTNTIWADCGDVSIEYGGYIGSLEDAIARLTARVEALENP